MKRTVFVTGGSRGIGSAVVKKFASEGDNVFFTYRVNDEAAKNVMSETGAIGIRSDVSDIESVRQAVKQARIFYGARSIDVLVANAGISRTGLFSEMKTADAQEIMNINFGGISNAISAVTDGMVEVKSGNIVCVSSMWGIRGASMESVYAASKAAVIGLARSLARELGPSGIRVNAVAPGVIDTDMCGNLDERTREELAEETPLQRLGSPEDVANGIYFLASNDADFITGQVLSIDGGITV